MNKLTRQVWSLKELKAVLHELGADPAMRKRYDIIPICIECNVPHGKSEPVLIRPTGEFCCKAKTLKMLRATDPSFPEEELEGMCSPYPYGQSVYPLFQIHLIPKSAPRNERSTIENSP